MNTFPLPEEVTAPRMHWRLIKVLYKGDPTDPEEHVPDNYSVAVGMWDDQPSLAIRWNCNEERPVGHPHSRGLPTWFIVPKELVESFLTALPPDVQSFARGILR